MIYSFVCALFIMQANDKYSRCLEYFNTCGTEQQCEESLPKWIEDRLIQHYRDPTITRDQ